MHICTLVMDCGKMILLRWAKLKYIYMDICQEKSATKLSWTRRRNSMKTHKQLHPFPCRGTTCVCLWRYWYFSMLHYLYSQSFMFFLGQIPKSSPQICLKSHTHASAGLRSNSTRDLAELSQQITGHHVEPQVWYASPVGQSISLFLSVILAPHMGQSCNS